MNRFHLSYVAAILGIGLLLEGCTQNNVVMSIPAPNVARQVAIQNAAKPCMWPDDQKGAYASPIVVKSLNVEPQRAKDQHMNGCASVVFNLDMNGNPTNVRILTESPVGYDYGSALVSSVQGSTYKPPVSTVQLYSTMSARTYNPNPTSK